LVLIGLWGRLKSGCALPPCPPPPSSTTASKPFWVGEFRGDRQDADDQINAFVDEKIEQLNRTIKD
jgi:hypothetical protein